MTYHQKTLLERLSLLDTEGVTAAFNFLLFFDIESTPGPVVLNFPCVYAVFSNRSWHMAAHIDPGFGSVRGFFLFKGSVPFCCFHIYIQYQQLLTSQ